VAVDGTGRAADQIPEASSNQGGVGEHLNKYIVVVKKQLVNGEIKEIINGIGNDVCP
jgi:uncharacterized protein YdbL (DUF1318 family)